MNLQAEVIAEPAKRQRNGEAATRSLAKRPLINYTEEQRAEVCNAVLAAYMDGQQIREIAPQYKVSDVTIYALLLRDRPDEWREIQTARALARLERAQAEMRAADDMLSLARARDEVKAAQFELERLLARFYSAKQEVTHTHKVDLESAIQAAERRIRAIAASHTPSIEGESTVEDVQATDP